MDDFELQTLLRIAESEEQPLHVRRGVMERLDKLNCSLDLGSRHRLEKVQHAVRREFNLATRNAGL